MQNRSDLQRGNLAGLLIGGIVCALLFWTIRSGDPSTMQIAGITLANPETQAPKVLVENIGVHGIIGNGAHSHGALSSAQQNADKEQHTKVEADIFKKPGGLYTQADIDRNGPQTPSQKYDGIMARHDLKVARGERICPITETKANASFTWWMNGKAYEFCCPPCVEEFVLKAKRGDAVAMKAPEAYVKR